MLKTKFTFLLLLSPLALQGDQISFSFYNDFFAGSDKHFSNGGALSWLDEDNSSSNYTNFLLDITNALSINLDKSKNYNAGITLSQITITPENTNLQTIQYEDMPYAGYAALSTYLLQWDEKKFCEYKISLGVVGKEAMSEEIQKSFHKLIDNKEPKGWNTQLKTQYTINFLLQYGEITWESQNNNSFHIDWFNHFGATLGNFNTTAFGGSILRLGKNYAKNFNTHYPYLADEASLIELDTHHEGFGWSLNGGVDGQLLAYSYVLDEAQKEGYNSDKNLLSASLYFGGDLYYFNHKLSLFYQSQSPYTKAETKTDFFGGIVYAYRF